MEDDSCSSSSYEEVTAALKRPGEEQPDDQSRKIARASEYSALQKQARAELAYLEKLGNKRSDCIARLTVLEKKLENVSPDLFPHVTIAVSGENCEVNDSPSRLSNSASSGGSLSEQFLKAQWGEWSPKKDKKEAEDKGVNHVINYIPLSW